MEAPAAPRWRLNESQRRRMYLWVTAVASASQLLVAALLAQRPGASRWEPLLGSLILYSWPPHACRGAGWITACCWRPASAWACNWGRHWGRTSPCRPG